MALWAYRKEDTIARMENDTLIELEISPFLLSQLDKYKQLRSYPIMMISYWVIEVYYP